MEKDSFRGEAINTGWDSLNEVEFQGEKLNDPREYGARVRELEMAISESETSDEEKQRAITAMRATKEIVLTHVGYEVRRAPESMSEAKAFDQRRVRAHDRMIWQLNRLNSMADKYGTKRFTDKDYMTRTEYDTINNPTQEERERMYSDRREVEDYFDQVFDEEIKRETRRIEELDM